MRFTRFITVTRFMGFMVVAFAGVLAAQQPWNRDFGEDMKRLVPILDLRDGQTVADVGAGGGELTVRLARQVGPQGHVYATEIDSSRIELIRRKAQEDGVKNVTVLEGHAARTNLPAACCDAIVIRNVYHHFDDPAAMNKSLYASVKPGGRLAIIDFSPNRGRRTAEAPVNRDQDSHGVDADTVIKEISEAGFERHTLEKGDDRSFIAVFRKPS